MSWNDHDHRGDYAETSHTHSFWDLNDAAEKYHRHYDLENDVEKAQRRITALQDEVDGLRGQLGNALERIRALEGWTPQARQRQLEADQAVADLAESGYDRHGRDCGCSYCYVGEEDRTEERSVSQAGKPPDICPETSDGYHCTHYQEGVSCCCACGSEPEPDEPEPEPAYDYDPGPEIDDEGGISEYRYLLPEDYERGQS